MSDGLFYPVPLNKLEEVRRVQHLFSGPVYMVSGGRANFSLISLKTSTNCLHENANSSRGGRDNSGGRVVSSRQVG